MTGMPRIALRAGLVVPIIVSSHNLLFCGRFFVSLSELQAYLGRGKATSQNIEDVIQNGSKVNVVLLFSESVFEALINCTV